MALLDKKIEVLKNNTKLFISINGYADAIGDEKYNLQLSAKRANTVKKYMIDKGISLSRFKQVKGLGESNFVNNCDDTAECTEAQHRLNRRAEILIMR
jgi:outer membrane protein OmpA-like peptidoglycan-associated protein